MPNIAKILRYVFERYFEGSVPSLSDWIQIANVTVVTLTLIFLAWQTFMQNRLLKAQLLRDRFDMYWQTYEPVSDDHMKDFRLHPDDYMARDHYNKKYKGNKTACRRYVYMTIVFEYLVFLHTLQKMGVDDPLGKHWIKQWVVDLSESTEFMDVKDYYRSYYPDFCNYVDHVKLTARPTRQSPRAKKPRTQAAE